MPTCKNNKEKDIIPGRKKEKANLPAKTKK